MGLRRQSSVSRYSTRLTGEEVLEVRPLAGLEGFQELVELCPREVALRSYRYPGEKRKEFPARQVRDEIPLEGGQPLDHFLALEEPGREATAFLAPGKVEHKGGVGWAEGAEKG